jgi:hypothetical protein
MRIYERFYRGFKGFSKLLYSYQQYKTLMNWDKCGTRCGLSAMGETFLGKRKWSGRISRRRAVTLSKARAAMLAELHLRRDRLAAFLAELVQNKQSITLE